MARIKHKKYHNPGEHIWPQMEKYEFSKYDEMLDWLEGEIEERIGILRNMKSGEYIVYSKINLIEDQARYGEKLNINDTRPFLSIIEMLKEYGLEIGKGNSEFGFRMPLPENGKLERELIIFKRK